MEEPDRRFPRGDDLPPRGAVPTRDAAPLDTDPGADTPEGADPSGLASLLDLVELMLRSTKDGAAELGAKDMIEGLVLRAPEVVEGAAWASVTVVRSGVLKTLTASHPQALRVDTTQYETGSGPCLDAILDDHVFVTGDVSRDERWPEFGARTSQEVGLHSVLAFRLVLLDESKEIAGLNLYSPERNAFDDEAVRNGTMLATQCSLLVSAHLASDEAENLARAMVSNREIGVAMGVLMTRNNLTREQAFALLRMASQDLNRKVSDIAAEVADTGQLPLKRLRPRR